MGKASENLFLIHTYRNIVNFVFICADTMHRYRINLGKQCSPERNLSKEMLLQLMDCSFIDRAENILIDGKTGCGKSDSDSASDLL